MKYTTPLLLLMIACSCGNNSANVSQKRSEKQENTPPSKAVDAVEHYRHFVDSLDPKKLENVSVAGSEFVRTFNGQNPDLADKGYVLFETFYGKAEKEITKVFEKDYDKYDLYAYADTLGNFNFPAEIKAFQKKLNANGFTIAEDGEGGSFLNKDRTAIFNWFDPLLSNTMKDYLHETAIEQTDWLSYDAGISISEEEYVRRLLFWEDFLKNNPNFVYFKEAQGNYKDLLSWFLAGMDNTPVYWKESDQIDPYFTKAYSLLAKKYKTSQTNVYVAPYFNLLKAGKWKEASDLLKKYSQKGVIEKYWAE